MICEVQAFDIMYYVYVYVYIGIAIVVQCDIPIIYVGMTNKKSGTLLKKPWHHKPLLIGHAEPTVC